MIRGARGLNTDSEIRELFEKIKNAPLNEENPTYGDLYMAFRLYYAALPLGERQAEQRANRVICQFFT
jgi:hypothetical protein